MKKIDITSDRLRHILSGATQPPWFGHNITHSDDPRGPYNTALIEMAPDLAQEVLRLREELQYASTVPQHPDDESVDRFAVAMKAKLAKKRADGRCGWQDKNDCTQVQLSEMLVEHVGKGDPVDVANLAMMLHERNQWIITTAQAFDAKDFLNSEAAYYSTNEGQLDDVPFENVAKVCRTMRDRIAAKVPYKPVAPQPAGGHRGVARDLPPPPTGGSSVQTEGRWETDMEHMDRDMREGHFPGRSKRQWIAEGQRTRDRRGPVFPEHLSPVEEEGLETLRKRLIPLVPNHHNDDAHDADSRRAAPSAQPVRFGAGNWVVVTGTYDESPALFIEPARTPGKVGETAEREGIPRDRLIPGALVFTFPTPEQARAVADAICCPAPSVPAEVEGLAGRGNTLTKGLEEWGDNEPRLSRGDWREINGFVRDATARLTALQAENERLRGDAHTLRGYINTHGETPSMTASNRNHWKARAEKAEDIAGRLAAHLDDCLEVLPQEDRGLCCDGRMCGCRGATVHEQAIHLARAALTAYEKLKGEA